MEQIWTTSIGKQQGIDLLNAHAQWYCNDIEPVTTYPFQNWADTGNNLWKQRNETDTDWIVRGILDAAQFGLIPIDGWISGLTAVYASATSITIAGIDVTDRIQQGTKIRYKQGGEYKYDFVSEVSFATDSTLTLMGGSTVEEEAITDFAYSNIATPIGWPFGVDYIEGSNENGSWTKWTNGKMEVDGTASYSTIEVTSTALSIFSNNTTLQILFAAPFYEKPRVCILGVQEADSFLWIRTGEAPLTNQYTQGFRLCSASSQTVNNLVISYHAIGRWKE